MDDLIQAVSQQTGFDLATSEKAVTAVLESLRLQLPAPLMVQLDGALGNRVAEMETGIGEVLNGDLGGLFTRKKD